MEGLTGWIANNYDEILGVVLSFVYIYFQIKQKIWLWPLGLISASVYILVFYRAGIYADMGLQIYYVVISIYGWYYWSVKKSQEQTNKSIKSVQRNLLLNVYLILATVVLFIFLSQILIRFTDSKIPYIDAFTTALSLVATWMLAKKYIEHWLVWIVVDAISSAVYFYKELYFTVVLYFAFTILAIIGHKAWLKDYQANPEMV